MNQPVVSKCPEADRTSGPNPKDRYLGMAGWLVRAGVCRKEVFWLLDSGRMKESRRRGGGCGTFKRCEAVR